MSRLLHTQLFQLLETLQQAVGVIDELIERNAIDSLTIVLQETQSGMIEMGTRIERVYGTNTKSVKNLEKLCELLYQLSIQNITKQRELLNNLKIQMWDLRQNLELEIDNRIEIVFLPYKYSMWDSLKTIYRAAKQDTSCDVKCVPIPYYTKKPDGSLGEMHDESKSFKDNLQIVGWRDYSFRDHRPDIVYIHNPYDNCNYVTSVHPDFYASELKKYVEKLVYVPYFVVDDKTEKSNLTHFIHTPGVIYSDKVILQSEHMKEIYMEGFSSLLRQNGVLVKQEELNQKFVALGSPKLELASMEQTIEIPEEWKNKIYKKDGERKKVIFYNTGVSAILKCGRLLYDKMKWVFEQFHNHREDFVLLWRPHPLIEDTLKSMREDLLDEYIKIRDKYIECAEGIYDDSVELNRAIQISDGYYGVPSSVAELFKAAGKRVLFQLESVYQVKPRIVPRYHCVWRIDDEIYLTVESYNSLFKLDLTKNKLYNLGLFPCGRLELTFQVVAVEKENNYLFYLSRLDSRLMIFDLQTQKFNKVMRLHGESYIMMLCHDKKVFLIPEYNNPIIIYDVKSEQFSYISSYPEKYKELYNKEIHNIGTWTRGYTYNDKLYFATGDTPTLLEIDTETEEISLDPLAGDTNAEIIAMCGCKEKVYVLIADGKLIEWNIHTKSVRVLAADIEVADPEIAQIKYVEDKLLLIGRRGISGFTYDLNEQKIYDGIIVGNKDKYIDKEDITALTPNLKQIIWGCKTGDIVSYDFETQEMTELFQAGDIDWAEFIGYRIDQLADENGELEDSLVCLSTMFFDYSFQNVASEQKYIGCGKRIHEYIKDTMQTGD